MLALLKPWRALQDLIGSAPTWSSALEDFLKLPTNLFARRFTENAQFYYECKDSSTRAVDKSRAEEEKNGYSGEESARESEDEEDMDDLQTGDRDVAAFSESDLETCLIAQANSKENRHSLQAVKIAIEAGMFEQEGATWSSMSGETKLLPAAKMFLQSQIAVFPNKPGL
ncbi:hypothetical protein M378DRAFT_160319 [Amanita muscaria Koide BX008]|uniref:Uncharacterized protein n=1 Tax=Amanita muscaria (strain Koide BX008) TaxID=946122 RepID=A0A0C2XBS6_AMAMK|nr:hypothetical protein M378DRAFT_160319 [Amanita muscaria Koide BX008]